MPIYRRTLLEMLPLTLLQSASAPADLAKEIVGVSHGNLARVRELLKTKPSLANASWDWGFGDWETPLGAASHVGARAIASLLIENGAAPTLFSATMLGQLDLVKALIAANPGAQRIPGPHSISLLAHARAGGDAAKPVFQFLESLGDAGSPPLSPLTEEQLGAIVGTYAFGAIASDRVQITAIKGQVEWRRTGGDARRLFHLGDLGFHPAGAKAVRIQFDGAGGLTVLDGEINLRATRVDQAPPR